MPYTVLKKFSVQTAGSNSGTWGDDGTAGDDLNSGVMEPLDGIVAGLSPFSVSSSNVSLTFTAGGGGDVQNVMWRFTGTLLANITVSPTAGDATTYFNGFYMIENATTGTFTITLQNASGSVVLPQGRKCVVYVNTTNSIAPRIIAGGDGDVPAGSKTIWYNTAAPSGWTAESTNDFAIKIASSGNGGVTSGSIAYSTLFGRTATDSHTLTLSQIPLHGHPFRLGLGEDTTDLTGGMALQLSGINDYAGYTGTLNNSPGQQIGGAGGGGSHTHNIDMRVQTAAFTLCQRD